MGVIKEFTCPSCHKTWNLHLEHGLMHGDFKRVLKEFPADVQNEILENACVTPTPLFSFHYRAAICHHCEEVTAVPVMYLHETKQTYKAGCPICGRAVELMEKASEITCPKCKKNSLSSKEIGHWD